jgi:hypothetical protein
MRGIIRKICIAVYNLLDKYSKPLYSFACQSDITAGAKEMKEQKTEQQKLQDKLNKQMDKGVVVKPGDVKFQKAERVKGITV